MIGSMAMASHRRAALFLLVAVAAELLMTPCGVHLGDRVQISLESELREARVAARVVTQANAFSSLLAQHEMFMARELMEGEPTMVRCV